MDSSEDTPSEHSSLYNVWPTASLSKGTSGSSYDQASHSEERESSRQPRAVLENLSAADKSIHPGTRLFAITEHVSFATLKTMPSTWTFQQRLVAEKGASPGIGSEKE